MCRVERTGWLACLLGIGRNEVVCVASWKGGSHTCGNQLGLARRQQTFAGAEIRQARGHGAAYTMANR